MSTNDDKLIRQVRELRHLLAVCVKRLGGHVVITNDDDDYESDVTIQHYEQHSTELRSLTGPEK